MTPFTDAPLAATLSASARLADDFDILDDSRWARSSHTLGRGPLRPANVSAQDGRVLLATRSAGFEGAEIRTLQSWQYGTFSAHARCNAPRGTLCTLFMYQIGVGDRADEIDIEIISGTREVWFTTWLAGKRVNHASHTLRFDPAAGFNTYTIDRTANQIRFLVNGELLHTFRHASAKKLPQSAMPLFANSWWPTWLAPAAGEGRWEIDWIEVR